MTVPETIQIAKKHLVEFMPDLATPTQRLSWMSWKPHPWL